MIEGFASFTGQPIDVRVSSQRAERNLRIYTNTSDAILPACSCHPRAAPYHPAALLLTCPPTPVFIATPIQFLASCTGGSQQHASMRNESARACPTHAIGSQRAVAP
eukprot:6177180-Pleurochrysis_carterae.AAC.7